MDPIKILLVDDSKSARYALRLHLQHHGVQVDTADSAEAALERIAQTQPEAVLMDHTMPGMNGFEALDILKSDLSTAHIPVVMCTSHDDPAYAAQALKRGALTVLSKADAADNLAQVLQKIQTALTARAEPVEVAPSPVPEPQQAVPATPVPTRADIETWIEAHLSRRLAEAMEPQLARLTTQLRRVIVEQVEMAVDALAALVPAPSPAPVPAPIVEAIPVPIPEPVPQAPPIDLEHLREEVIPAAVRRHFDSERDGLLKLVQQCIQESQAQHEEDPDALRKILETVDAIVMDRGTQIARREAEGVVQAAHARDRETLAALQQKLRNSHTLGIAAIILAIGAAAVAFLV